MWKAHDTLFKNVHQRNLVYNTCWEDPRIDRQLLEIGTDSRILVITSAGCNALEYLLDDPAEVHAVDVNPAQNALLALKIAFFRHLDHQALFGFFGDGAHPQYREIYRRVRPHLPAFARQYWDQHIAFFKPARLKGSFYFRGTSGLVAWSMCHLLMRLRPGLYPRMQRLVDAASLEEQEILYRDIAPLFWNTVSRFIARHPLAMTMVGVPRLQIDLIRRTYPGGLEHFVMDKIRQVLTQTCMSENYFWRVYLTGSYTRTCCPNYLRQENFDLLRDRVERLRLHTVPITAFLQSSDLLLSHFVLLDHMDWLASYNNVALTQEWDWILKRSSANARYLLRSAAPSLDFFPARVQARLHFQGERTRALHPADRVGTYGSVHLATASTQ
ncbi:MAG TPA: BtaA family protein [Calditrichia bacterium]|nr:BtaA family protein [Calditrichia bacterium]